MHATAHRVPWGEAELSHVHDLGPLDVVGVVTQDATDNGLVGRPGAPEPGTNDGMVASVCCAIVEHVAGQVAHHVDVGGRREVAAKFGQSQWKHSADPIIAEALLAEVAKAGVQHGPQRFPGAVGCCPGD